MMKLILLIILWTLALLFIVSQLILPLFTRLDFFWLFRDNNHVFREKKVKEPKPQEPAKPAQSLDELEHIAEEKTQSYKEVLDDIYGVEQKVREIKNKTRIENEDDF